MLKTAYIQSVTGKLSTTYGIFVPVSYVHFLFLLVLETDTPKDNRAQLFILLWWAIIRAPVFVLINDFFLTSVWLMLLKGRSDINKIC